MIEELQVVTWPAGWLAGSTGRAGGQVRLPAELRRLQRTLYLGLAADVDVAVLVGLMRTLSMIMIIHTGKRAR